MEFYSARKAILVGHAVINVPMAAIIVAVWLYGRLHGVPDMLGLGTGAALSWPWWAVAAPRWRAWAIEKGVPRATLQRLAVLNGLLWPKGWIFEKSEIPVRRR